MEINKEIEVKFLLPAEANENEIIRGLKTIIQEES